MARLKAEPPLPREEERLRDTVGRILGYLREQKRELEYVLENLGAKNINGAGLALSVRSGDGRTEAGTVGAVGSGVGLASGTASVRVTDGEILLTVGERALRVTAEGVYKKDNSAWVEV